HAVGVHHRHGSGHGENAGGAGLLGDKDVVIEAAGRRRNRGVTDRGKRPSEQKRFGRHQDVDRPEWVHVHQHGGRLPQTERAGSSRTRFLVVDEGQMQSEQELSVSLVHARWRHLSWVVFGIGLGALLWLYLGTIAQWAGVVLMVLG